MDTTFQIPENSPAVYKVKLEKPNEVLHLFKDVILQDATAGEVKEALCRYVTSSIEPIGWRALWRTKDSLDFEVEVMDVSHHSLEAIVVVLRLLSPDASELTPLQMEETETLLKVTKTTSAPLSQLYVISENDTEEQYYQTALVIEQIRFFCAHIWRPWDDLLNNGFANEPFAKKLEQRIEFYFDMKDKILPQSTVNKAIRLIKEASNIKDKIDSLNNFEVKNFGDSDEQNDSVYIDEQDLMEALKLKLRLENIDREMKLLEDKHLRILASSIRSDADYDSDDERSGSDPMIHLVSKKLNVNLVKTAMNSISNMEIDDNTEIAFHNTIEKAISLAKSGDKVLIMPGLYKCGALPWIECDMQLIGFNGTKEEIVLQTNDNMGDIFLNCNCDSLKISGITFIASSELQTIIMIHSGHVMFNDCIIDASNCARNTITALSKAKLEMEDCQVLNAQVGDGIVTRSDSIVINNKSDTKMDANEENE